MLTHEERLATALAFSEAVQLLDLYTEEGRQEFGRLMRERDAKLSLNG